MTDGTALVSYGEPARIGDRVVFSMPTAATPNPPLHLVDLAAARVDWERTNRYAEAARAAHYINTQAEFDYAALSARMTLALNQLMETEDAARRLAIAENARKMLAAWPQAHYNYRLNEVRQMLSLLDEAIADLRAAAAMGDSISVWRPLPIRRPPRAARAAADAERDDRTGIDCGPGRRHRQRAHGASRDGAGQLSIATRPRCRPSGSRRRAPRRGRSSRPSAASDRAYQSLTTRIIGQADRRATRGDVRSLVRLVDRVRLERSRARRPASRNGGGAHRGRGGAARRGAPAPAGARSVGAARAGVPADTARRSKRRSTCSPALEPSLEQIKLLAGSSPIEPDA